MGWTSLINDDYRFKTNKGFYEAELKYQWGKSGTVLEVAFVGSKIYELVEIVKECGEKFKMINVIFISRYKENKNNRAEIAYKYLSEDVGPASYDCPVKFLKASTYMHKNAIKWRENCYEYRKELSEHKKLVEKIYKKMPVGTVVETHNGNFVRVVNSQYKNNWYTGYNLTGSDKDKLFKWNFKYLKGIAFPNI